MRQRKRWCYACETASTGSTQGREADADAEEEEQMALYLHVQAEKARVDAELARRNIDELKETDCSICFEPKSEMELLSVHRSPLGVQRLLSRSAGHCTLAGFTAGGAGVLKCPFAALWYETPMRMRGARRLQHRSRSGSSCPRYSQAWP